MFAEGSRLAKVVPPSIVAVEFYNAIIPCEITRITIANLTNDVVRFWLYHGDDATFDNTTVLWNDIYIRANDSFDWGAHAGAGYHMEKDHRLGIRCSVTGGISCHVYGITTNVAPN